MKTTQEKHIFSVTELTRNIRSVLEGTFGTIWIEGEISNFTKHQSGHMYFSIKDAQSVLSCVIFRRVNAGIKFEIKSGMHVLCFGKISVYDKRGQYQLYVEEIEPRGKGALQMAFEQLKEKLREEGLFDKSRKRPIPYLPQKIGVVTSPTGAAIRDILNVTKRRFSNIEIIISPARVQGDTAKHEIVEAIKLFNELRNVDVIIVGRGGGSLEDLWSFNEEIVARAIRDSKIPIISAVGHEVDWTISDFVSDFRAPTPSAAAELVIPRKEDLLAALKNMLERMNVSLMSKIGYLSEHLNALKKRYVMREPKNVIIQYEQEIDHLLESLNSKAQLALKFKKDELKSFIGRLNALNPLAILERGYSVTIKEKGNHIVKNVKELREKDIIKTKLYKGEILSEIKKLKNN